MVIFLLYIAKSLWAAFIMGIGLFAAFLTTLFLAEIFLDLVKDMVERIKKNK
jgi:hypothetical protein